MAAPTGCFKCGRPGHWSRDCPSSGGDKDNGNTNSRFSSSNATPSSGKNNSSSNNNNDNNWKKPFTPNSSSKSGGKPPAIPRKRPKLTPDLLLSNDGIGYVLENFPRMVKIQGPGHELDDLKTLLDAYVHWHSRILPYFSFDQFVERVEKVGSTKRVRVCIRELKDKVARGEDLKLTEAANVPEEGKQTPSVEDSKVATPWEEPHDDGLPDDVQEDLFHEFYRQAVTNSEDPSKVPSSTADSEGLPPCQWGDGPMQEQSVNVAPTCINEEQMLRMEANRLKALERAKARTAAAAATL